MQIRTIITFLMVFSLSCGKAQYRKKILPKDQRDSVFIFFLIDNSRYYINELGTIDNNRCYEYKIFLEFGEDLCFTTEYRAPDSYTKTYTFEELAKYDIKDYWHLYENYMDEDVEKLLDKLNWYSTDFYLVIPDSTKNQAKVLSLYNCNNYED